MSISAVNGVSQLIKPTDDVPAAVTPVAAVTPFSQQLDAQAAAAKGHHHHHAGSASQSVTSSPAAAASTAGAAAPAGIAASLLHLKI